MARRGGRHRGGGAVNAIRVSMRVGQRRGTAVIQAVRAAALAETGRDLFLASNGVRLTKRVPPAFLKPWEPK